MSPHLFLSLIAGSMLLLGCSSRAGITIVPLVSERSVHEIPAAQPGWIDTGITLGEDERATISVAGEASWDGGISVTGPEGITLEGCVPAEPDLPVSAPLVRTGAAAPRLAAGATVHGPGEIALTYNDCPEQHFDNAGSFTASLTVLRLPARSPQPSGALPPLLPVAALALLGGGALCAGCFLLGPRWRFDDTARLESSAWLAPMRLRDLQGGRFPKRALTVGGPDADIDFGFPEVRARILALADGATRVEPVGRSGRIYVNDVPVGTGQQLASGQRVRIEHREFLYYAERISGDGAPPSGDNLLEEPDLRVA